MRPLRWIVGSLGALIFGATANEAFYGDRIGLVVAGLLLSLGCVVVACVVLEDR